MKEKRSAVMAVLGSLLVGGAALLIQTPLSWKTGWLIFHGTLVATTAYAGFHIGGARLFLMSLHAYKTKLRHAYIALAAGIVILAFSTFQVAIIAAFNWWGTFWVHYGLIILPFLLAAIFVYIGTRSLARLVGAKTILTRSWLALPAAAVLSFLTALLPHAAISTPEIAFRSTIGLVAWTMWVFVIASLISLSVMRHIGAHYKVAMAWLAAGLFGSAFVLFIVNIHSLTTSASQDVASLAIDAVGMLAGVVYLIAGYIFAKTSEI